MESTILSDAFEQEDTRGAARPSENQDSAPVPSDIRIESGDFSNVPPEIIHHILRFLSPQDLLSCSIVCKFLCHAASDESLWRRLHCMRWGYDSTSSKPRASAWKNLYIQRDGKDTSECFRDLQPCERARGHAECKKAVFQMEAAMKIHVAMRSQAPPPSQVNNELIILDTTVADQVSIWMSSRGFTVESMTRFTCSGHTCPYAQDGHVFISDKTNHIHVCDNSCHGTACNPSRGLLICTISRQYLRWLGSEEEDDDDCDPMYWWL